MTTIQALVGNEAVAGTLGIEIETESAEEYRVPAILGWRAERDGSLRDFGREYITVGCVTRDGLKDSLNNWKTGLGNVHRKLRTNSISTSVHVHVNVQDHTPLEALNFYLTSILFENVLANYAGPDRVGNLFCLRTVDAEDQYNSIKAHVKEASNEFDLLRSFNPNNYKYSNINTVPITGQGSMEFRVMRGTTDPEEINLWGMSLADMQGFSRQFSNPVDIVRKMRELGPDGLLASAFGANADQFKYRGWERDLLRNFIYVADMATCRQNGWEIASSQSHAERKRQEKEAYDRMMAERMVRRAAAAPQAVGAVAWDEDFEEEDI